MRPLSLVSIVVVGGPAGAARRVRVGGSQVCAAAGGALLLAILVAGALWALAVWQPCAEGLAAARSDARGLRAEISALERQLSPLRAQGRRLHATAGRVWAHSGLRGAFADLAEGAGEEPGAQGAGAAAIGALDGAPAAPRPGPSMPERTRRLGGEAERLAAALDHILESYHDRRQLLAYTPSIRPAQAPWPSSSFGPRLDPLTGAWVLHKGLDLAGNRGQPIIAPANGRVIWVGWRGGYGRTVVVDHGYGLQTHFAHLDAYHVRPGQPVQRGEVIASMGSTGRSTGPHLHYEVRRGGQPLDPRRFILD